MENYITIDQFTGFIFIYTLFNYFIFSLVHMYDATFVFRKESRKIEQLKKQIEIEKLNNHLKKLQGDKDESDI